MRETTWRLEDSKPFFYRIDASPRYALLCLLPKSGSSMWNRALTSGLIAQGFPMDNAPGKWYSQQLPYNVSFADIPHGVHVPRFVLVRHPISRLLSAYLGKIKTGIYRDWHPDYNRSSGFAGFVRHITAMDPRKLIDGHFQLQRQQCGLQQDDVHFGGSTHGFTQLRVEEMGIWYRSVICRLGLTQTVSSPNTYWRSHDIEMKVRPSADNNAGTACFVQTEDCGCDIHCNGHTCNASGLGGRPSASFGTFNLASERLEDYYDDQIAQLVNAWAKPDLDYFGYLPWRPGRVLADCLRNKISSVSK